MCGNKPSLRVITGREPVLVATPALIGLAPWHRCSEMRTDIAAFGAASVSLNSALAVLQSGSGRASPCGSCQPGQVRLPAAQTADVRLWPKDGWHAAAEAQPTQTAPVCTGLKRLPSTLVHVVLAADRRLLCK